MGKPEVLALEEVRELATLRWQEVMEYSPEAMARRVRNLCATVERHVVEASGLAAGMPLLRGSLGDAESERDRLRGLVAGMREEIERLLELAGARRDLAQALVDQGCTGDVVIWMNRGGRGIWLRDVLPTLALLADPDGVAASEAATNDRNPPAAADHRAFERGRRGGQATAAKRKRERGEEILWKDL